jgi:hypothetical protein
VVRAAKLLARWGRRGALARLARRLWQSAAFLAGGEGEEDGGPRSIDSSSSGGDSGGDGGARRPLPATEDVASLVAAGQATCVYRVDASLSVDVPPVVHSSSGSGSSGTSSGSSGGPAAAPDVRAKIKAWGSPSPAAAGDQPTPPPRIATDMAATEATAALPAQLAAAMMASTGPGPEGGPWALPLPTRLRLVEAALVEELLAALGPDQDPGCA